MSETNAAAIAQIDPTASRSAVPIQVVSAQQLSIAPLNWSTGPGATGEVPWRKKALALIPLSLPWTAQEVKGTVVAGDSVEEK